MKTIYIVFVFFLLSAVLLEAQSKNSVVHLKNGSIIKGTVIELKETNQLKIQIENGSELIVNNDDVSKIVSSNSNQTFGSFVVGNQYKILLTSGSIVEGKVNFIKENGEIIIKNDDGFDITLSNDQISQVLPISVADIGSLGVGFGIQYGILGINLDLALSNYISFSAGVGHTVLADIGYNGGFKIFFRGPENSWRPRIGIYYGINGLSNVFSLEDDEIESFRGFSILVGQQWMFGDTKTHGLDLDIVFLVTSGVFNRMNELEEMGYTIIEKPGFIKFSIGYRFGF